MLALPPLAHAVAAAVRTKATSPLAPVVAPGRWTRCSPTRRSTSPGGARGGDRSRPVCRGAGGGRARHRRRRGDAAEAPRRLADPVLDALEVRAEARLCCYRPVWSVLHVAFFTLGESDGGVVLRLT